MKDDLYINNFEKINKFKINKEIEKINLTKEIEIINFDKLLKVDKFSDLFTRSNSTGTRGIQRQTRVVQPSVQPPSQTQQPARQEPITQTQGPQGRSYDASQMWSPTSIAGKLYEWNRGVIGVSLDGTLEKENLDGTFNHHADATVRVVNSLGGNIEMTSAPFEAAVNGSKEGILVFQSEGDNAFVYLPEAISEEQYEGLVEIITPRGGFNFSFTHSEEIFEEQTVENLLAFASNLKSMAVGGR